MLPAGHSKAEDMPGNGQYVPAGHTRANKLPVCGQKVPTGHMMGLIVPACGQYVPAGQGLEEPERAGHHDPAGHKIMADMPVKGQM